jgi:hypothetical protein
MTLTKAQYEDCKTEFLNLEERAIYLNHYQLARETTITDPSIWKAFLTDPRTVDYVQSEMNLIRTAAINDIIQQAPNSKSVGQAQLINSLLKLEEASSTKEGPIFIYCYVPLNEEQKFAPNTQITNPDGSPRTTPYIEPEEINENTTEWNLNEKFISRT